MRCLINGLGSGPLRVNTDQPQKALDLNGTAKPLAMHEI
jgi:hypothetical protein